MIWKWLSPVFPAVLMPSNGRYTCGVSPVLAFVPATTIRPNQQRCIELGLYFRNGESLLRKRKSWVASEATLRELQLGSIEYPHLISLMHQKDVNSTTAARSSETKKLFLRSLQARDLPSVVPMCVKEFGSGAPLSLDEVPWDEVSSHNLQQYTDRVLFGPLVQLALEMKIQQQQQNGAKPDYTILCLEDEDATVVGMVELSWQPPDAERNPPPVPLPFWAKQLWSRIRGVPHPNGWVSNLLVSDSVRGRGYSKLLMTAAEGLARSWGCTAIYLHVDADTVSGRIPQALYRGLGYEPVMDQQAKQKYDWMGPELANMGLYVVDGVPLLFLKKTLNETILQ